MFALLSETDENLLRRYMRICDDSMNDSDRVGFGYHGKLRLEIGAVNINLFCKMSRCGGANDHGEWTCRSRWRGCRADLAGRSRMGPCSLARQSAASRACVS